MDWKELQYAHGFRIWTTGGDEEWAQDRPRPTSFLGYIGYGYDVSADGQRFLVNELVDEASLDPITLFVNWPALLKR